MVFFFHIFGKLYHEYTISFFLSFNPLFYDRRFTEHLQRITEDFDLSIFQSEFQLMCNQILFPVNY